MNPLINILAYQSVWIVAVLGARAGHSLPGLAAAGGFACLHFTLTREWASDLRLAAVALLLGAVLDGSLSSTHLLLYAASTPALPIGGAPLWILALWLAFALTLNHSLKMIISRPALATALGLAGGPLAYLAAARFSAVQMRDPLWQPLSVLAVGWAAAMAFLGLVRGRQLTRRPPDSRAAAP